MIIDCISDLHGYYPELLGGDLLIVAGDLTYHDSVIEHCKFLQWLNAQSYKKKVYIAGNHDNFYARQIEKYPIYPDVEYLQDSGTEFEGLNIWGSPWSLWFEGINKKCMAFTGDEDQLKHSYELIPEDTNILITHSPIEGILDSVGNYTTGQMQYTGSISLRNIVLSKRLPNLKLHVFGHIHEWGGKILQLPTMKLVNASYVDEHYQPVNKPMRIEL
jgi:Icc-related predicted phosphoesterase